VLASDEIEKMRKAHAKQVMELEMDLRRKEREAREGGSKDMQRGPRQRARTGVYAQEKHNAAGDSANCLNISKYGVPGTSLCAAVVD
jgi:hypothetical protein